MSLMSSAPPVEAPSPVDPVGESWRRIVTGNRHERRWHQGRRALLHRALTGIRVPDTGIVLDVAAGDGEYAALVASITGGTLIASDRGLSGPREAAAAGRMAIRADARSLPFRDGCADITLAMEFFSYLTGEEIDRVLEELRRVTKPGGLLVVTSPNRYSLESWKGLARYLFNGTVWNAGSVGHRYVYSRAALASVLRGRFTVERWLGYYLIPSVKGRATPWTYVVTEHPTLIRLSHKLCLLARRPEGGS